MAMSCGVGHRRSSDPTLLWLWYRPVAIAPIQPLAWEPPYATGTALKTNQKKGKGRKDLLLRPEKVLMFLPAHGCDVSTGLRGEEGEYMGHPSWVSASSLMAKAHALA